jgi:hypothetical protein
MEKGEGTLRQMTTLRKRSQIVFQVSLPWMMSTITPIMKMEKIPLKALWE